MTWTDPSVAVARLAAWRSALLLPGETDPVESILRELVEYFGITREEALARCRRAVDDSREHWESRERTTDSTIAEFYDTCVSYIFEHMYWHATYEEGETLANVAALEIALRRRARTYLDFGGGVGTNALLFARNGIEVSQADVSGRLLEFTRWRFQRRGMTPPRTIDLRHETLPVERFDFATIVDVLEHIPDPVGAMADLARSLNRNGAVFVTMGFGADPDRPMHIIHKPWRFLARVRSTGLDRLQPLESREFDFVRVYRQVERWGVSRLAVIANDEVRTFIRRSLRYAGHLGATVLGTLAGPTDRPSPDQEGETGEELANPDEPLPLTVAVCTRNRPEMARQCLERLLACDPPPDRILVVDQSSDDETRRRLGSLDDPAGRMRVVPTGSRGLSRARNIAMVEAADGILAFTDDDCLPRHDWAGAIREAFDTYTAAGAITGAAVPEPGESLDRRQASATTWRPPGPKRFQYPVDPSEVGAGLNLAIRRSVALRAGGFDERIGPGESIAACDDSDFIHRLLRIGVPIVYTPDAIVAHKAWRGEAAQVRTDRDYARGRGGWAVLALRSGDLRPGWYLMRITASVLARAALSLLHLDPGKTAYFLSLVAASAGGAAAGLAAPRKREPLPSRRSGETG